MNNQSPLSDLIDELLTNILVPSENKKIYKDTSTCELDEDFENDCQMWLLQIKAFVLDSLADKNKRDSQTLINFLDSLNTISTIY
jgi:ribosomal protein L5